LRSFENLGQGLYAELTELNATHVAVILLLSVCFIDIK